MSQTYLRSIFLLLLALSWPSFVTSQPIANDPVATNLTASQPIEMSLRGLNDDQLERRAFDLFQGGKLAESLQCHEAIRKLFNKKYGIHHRRFIEATVRYGWTQYRVGKCDRAEKLYKEALELTEKVQGKNHPETLKIYSYLSENAYAAGKYKEARAGFTEAIELSEALFKEEVPPMAECYSGRGRALAKQNKYDLAVIDFERALAIFEKTLGAKSPPTLFTKRFLAFALLHTKRRLEAEEHFAELIEAIDVSGYPNDEESILLLQELADLQEEKGNLFAATDTLLRVLKIYERRGKSSELKKRLELVNTLAALYTHQGQYARATSLINRYRGWLPGKNSIPTKDGALLLLGFSSVLRQMGHLDEAHSLGISALSMARLCIGKEERTTPLFFQNLALIAMMRGDNQEAKEFYDEVLSLPFANDSNRESSSQMLLFSLAGRAFISNDNSETLTKLRQLEKLLPAESPLLPVTRLMLAVLCLLDNRMDEAQSLFSSIEKGKTTDQLFAISHLGQGKLFQDQALFEKALDHYERATELFERAVLRAEDEFHALAQRELITRLVPFVFEGAIDCERKKSPLAPKFTEAAFHILETVRSRAFLEELSQGQARSSGHLAKKDLELLWRLDKEIKEAQDIGQRLLLLEERQKINEELRRHNKEYDKLLRVKPTTFHELREELTEKEIMLCYFQSKDSLYLFVISRHEILLKKIVQSLPLLQRRVRQYRLALTKRIPKRPFVKTSHRLYEQIVEPISSLVEGQRLIILPHGCLLFVPFEALVEREEFADFSRLPYLFKKHELTYSPSATTWLLTRKMKIEEKQQLQQSAIIAFASSTYSQEQEEFCSLPPLPATSIEARNICALWQGGEDSLFLSERASESKLKELSSAGRLARYERIHIACHGLVPGPDNVKGQPSLALTPSSTDDGFLTMSEIYGLRTACNLFVLSACDTAYVDEPSQSQGISGLARAIFFSGTKHFVGSLWPVSDRGTEDLMCHFYEAQKRGQSVGSALQESRLKLITGRWSHPYHWSAFILMGP